MINSFYAQDQFNEKVRASSEYSEDQQRSPTDPAASFCQFGDYNAAKGTYGLTAAWQSGLSNAVQVGSIIGLMCNGILTDKFGYRRTMLGALALMMCFIFITFFAVNLTMLLIGEALCGLPWGVFQTLTVAFASEVCPVPLRPFLTTYVNLVGIICLKSITIG